MTATQTARTIAAYDKNANNYNARFENFSTYKKKLTSFQRQFVKKGARILDLGCGPGNNISTIKALDESCRFTGVDLSGSLLDIAKKIHPTCIFIQQNICHLDAVEQYDTILASFCIVHLDETETTELLQFIAESLVPGGSLYLSFMEGATSRFEKTSFSDEEIYFNYYQESLVSKRLEDNGLVPGVVSKEDYLEQDGSTTSDVFIYALKN